MASKRPVLSCWQKDTWTHGDTVRVTYPSLLKNKPGVKLSDPLIDVLTAAFDNAPIIVNIGSAACDSALLSRTTSANGVISARDSSLTADMRRLVIASYVSSRGVFADATMYGTGIKNYKNVLKPDGILLPGAGEFVISDPDIQTFSLTGMVTLAVVLRVLLATVSVVTTAASLSSSAEAESSGELRRNPSLWVRFKVLLPPQLLRCVYEGENGAIKAWPCGSLVPNMKVPKTKKDLMTKLAVCGKHGCRGHVWKESDDTHIGEAAPLMREVEQQSVGVGTLGLEETKAHSNVEEVEGGE